jgi:hypothetical protein
MPALNKAALKMEDPTAAQFIPTLFSCAASPDCPDRANSNSGTSYSYKSGDPGSSRLIIRHIKGNAKAEKAIFLL